MLANLSCLDADIDILYFHNHRGNTFLTLMLIADMYHSTPTFLMKASTHSPINN